MTLTTVVQDQHVTREKSVLILSAVKSNKRPRNIKTIKTIKAFK